MLKKSNKLWNIAQKKIAGGNHLISKNPNYLLPELWPTYYKNAKGIKIKDINNDNYLDFYLMGVGTNILGYSNKNIDQAVIKNIKRSNMSSFNCPEEVYLAEKLIEMNTWADKVRFARTGGEANSIAIRIARSYLPASKYKIAVSGYHGWHDWYLSANLTNKKNLNNILIPNIPSNGIPKVLKNTSYIFEMNNFESLNRLIKKNPEIGIIKMEIHRLEKPNVIFLQKLKELTKKKNIILIFDECTSGFRETFGGIFNKYKIYPDLAVFGKALGNGFPITAVIGRDKVMSSVKKTFISSTFWTERSGPTAALATLKEMKRVKSWLQISKMGNYIKKEWSKIGKKFDLNLQISGVASIPQFYIPSNNFLKYRTFITQEFLKKKILASNIIYISTAHDKKRIDLYLKNLDKIFEKIKEFETRKKIFIKKKYLIKNVFRKNN